MELQGSLRSSCYVRILFIAKIFLKPYDTCHNSCLFLCNLDTSQRSLLAIMFQLTSYRTYIGEALHQLFKILVCMELQHELLSVTTETCKTVCLMKVMADTCKHGLKSELHQRKCFSFKTRNHLPRKDEQIYF